MRHERLTNSRTALYRLYDADDRLLYVGITSDPRARWKTHAAEKAWWNDIAREDLRWHATRPSAEAEELSAIKTEAPLHNRQDCPEWQYPKRPTPPPDVPTKRVAVPSMDFTSLTTEEILTRLSAYMDVYRQSGAEAKAIVDEARHDRDEAIRKAARAGHSTGELVRASHLTRESIRMIIDPTKRPVRKQAAVQK